MAAQSILKNRTQVPAFDIYTYSFSKNFNSILELWMSSHPSGAARLASNPSATLGQHLAANPLRIISNYYDCLLSLIFSLIIQSALWFLDVELVVCA